MLNPENIIIRMPNWLGDLVMATPLLTDLRNRFPQARITAMCQANVAPLLEHEPAIDEILSFKKPDRWIHGNYRDIIQPIRYGNFDTGILTTNSFSSAWWFFCGRVHNRIGFSGNLRSLLLNKSIALPQNKELQHQTKTYKALLTPLDIPISNTPISLTVTDIEKEDAKKFLAKKGIFPGEHTIIGINPGAAYGSAKCWLPERFKELTKKLLTDPSVRVLYFGDRIGAPLVEGICADMPSGVFDLAGKTTIRELMAIMTQCNAVLSNDSGPMHIAAALKIPLVALFGSTSAIKTGPYEHGTVIHKHVPCSPCYLRTCPTKFNFVCMKQIQVNEVYEALLKETSGKILTV